MNMFPKKGQKVQNVPVHFGVSLVFLPRLVLKGRTMPTHTLEVIGRKGHVVGWRMMASDS